MKRIFIVRHAYTESNRDPNFQKNCYDANVPIVDFGRVQAEHAGTFLAGILAEERDQNPRSSLRVWHSPYLRTTQTKDGIVSQIEPFITHGIRSDERLRELEMGLFSGLTEAERTEKFQEYCELIAKVREGKTSYFERPPNGESPAQVSDRLNLFFDSLHRADRKHIEQGDPIDNLVIVAHGITNRCFVKRWKHYDEAWWEKTENPTNCSIWLLERGPDRGWTDHGLIYKPPALGRGCMALPPDYFDRIETKVVTSLPTVSSQRLDI